MSMSRIDADFFTKNLHYATSWWEEHSQNFCDMVEKLMNNENIFKLVATSSLMVLQFNAKSGWVSEKDNEIIESALRNLAMKSRDDKLVLSRLAKAYFSLFIVNKSKFDPHEILQRDKDNLANSPELLKLKDLFLTNEALLNDKNDLIKLTKEIMDPFDKELCLNSFYPSLILFFLRVFDIYDSALQGQTVNDLISTMEKTSKQKKEPQSEKEAIQSALGEKMLSKFGEAEFWKTRYASISIDTKPYDWYTTWHTIRSRVLDKTGIDKSEKPLNILELGCGNSELSTQIAIDENLNIEKIIAIDFVKEVVDAQNENTELRKMDDKLKFETVDDVATSLNIFSLFINFSTISQKF